MQQTSSRVSGSRVNWNRRTWLKTSFWGGIGLLSAGLGPFSIERGLRADDLKGFTSLKIRSIERTTVQIPYREVPTRAMDRELPHWRYVEVCEVKLDSGVVGIGETLLYYTWGVPSDEAIKQVIGKNAAEVMWQEGLGAGLQMAIFDAVGKTLQVPVYRLLGNKVNDKTPLSWWNIDMPPADMAAECAVAHKAGYMSYKTKGRPWFDLWAQVAQSCEVVPEDFKIDMDFNDTLLDADRALPILAEIEKYPQVDIFESPIPQSDVAGNRRICDASRAKVAMHYGTPEPAVVVREKCCDGFVVGGSASHLMEQALFAQEVDMPFWLQLVGTSITATYSLHFGAAFSHAKWPAVNCHQLYAESLTTETFAVHEGFAVIPEKPGIGVELDRDRLERFKIPRPEKRPDPERLVETTWPDGRKMYVSNAAGVNFMLKLGAEGKMPYFEKGVEARLYPNNQTNEWKELYEKAKSGPIFVKP